MSQGAVLPQLPPLTPPTPTTNTPLNAELAAQGRRAGLRAAVLGKISQRGGASSVLPKATKLSGE